MSTNEVPGNSVTAIRTGSRSPLTPSSLWQKEESHSTSSASLTCKHESERGIPRDKISMGKNPGTQLEWPFHAGGIHAGLCPSHGNRGDKLVRGY